MCSTQNSSFSSFPPESWGPVLQGTRQVWNRVQALPQPERTHSACKTGQQKAHTPKKAGHREGERGWVEVGRQHVQGPLARVLGTPCPACQPPHQTEEPRVHWMRGTPRSMVSKRGGLLSVSGWRTPRDPPYSEARLEHFTPTAREAVNLSGSGPGETRFQTSLKACVGFQERTLSFFFFRPTICKVLNRIYLSLSNRYITQLYKQLRVCAEDEQCILRRVGR